MDPHRQTPPPVVSFPFSDHSPSFTFAPPNPNPGVFTFARQNPNPNAPFTFGIPPPLPLPRAPPLRGLREAASFLKTLIDHAEKTFSVVSDILRLEKPLDRDDLGSCPLDSRHKMPPENLFLHTLRCLSESAIVDPEDLPPLKYRDSQRQESEFSSGSQFFGRQQNSGSDLCFSVDDDAGYNENFFYRDCPGVVGPSSDADMKRVFTLPRVLFAECVDNFCKKELNIQNQSHSLLPSDFLELKRELEGWTDYPLKISCCGLRAVSCVWDLKQVHAKRWIISNSPFHGIVIDVAMSDHLFLLLKLCLRAMLTDANRFVKEKTDNSYYDCPVIFEILTWLGSQLAILYGQVKGKLFAINMVKNSLLTVAHRVLLFRIPNGCELEDRLKGGSETGLVAGADEDCHDKRGGNDREAVVEGDVYVSQVAAAVSALFERASLEERIKGLRLSPTLSRFQLLSEHACLSSRADELRKRRLDYKPIIEHDGFLYQRTHDQDGQPRFKSREELLAEERDYKRRRMSYRGKKIKRTPVQVLRDIIEDHMDEIVQAGGIGCFVKSATEKGKSTAWNIPTDIISADIESKSNACSASEGSRMHSRDNTMLVNNDRNVLYVQGEFRLNGDKATTDYNVEGVSNKEEKDGRTMEYRYQVEGQKTQRKDKVGRSYGSRSPHHEKSNVEQFVGHEDGKRQDQAVYRRKNGHRDGNSSSRTVRQHDRFHSSSKPRISSEGRYIQRTESEDRYDSGKHRTSFSKSRTQDILEERYDPSVSYDTGTFGYDYSRSKCDTPPC